MACLPLLPVTERRELNPQTPAVDVPTFPSTPLNVCIPPRVGAGAEQGLLSLDRESVTELPPQVLGVCHIFLICCVSVWQCFVPWAEATITLFTSLNTVILRGPTFSFPPLKTYSMVLGGRLLDMEIKNPCGLGRGMERSPALMAFLLLKVSPFQVLATGGDKGTHQAQGEGL